MLNPPFENIIMDNSLSTVCQLASFLDIDNRWRIYFHKDIFSTNAEDDSQEIQQKKESRTSDYHLMRKSQIRFFKLELQLTDVFLIVILLFYSLLACAFNSRVKSCIFFILTNLGSILIFLALIYLHQKISSRRGRFFLRISSVSLILIYIYEASIRLSFIFFRTWQDQSIINLEQKIFGVEPTLWLQEFMSPGLTEWMMISYFLYFPLYPIFGAILYFKRGEYKMEDFLFTISINNILCNICYFLYPVANPISHLGHLYSVPLNGYLFTSIGEFIRENLISTGGAMPSGHVAATTIIWLMAYRYHRHLSYILAPFVIFIYISSVYCRFHYVSDIVAGILFSLFIWWMMPFLRKKLGLDPL